MSKFLKSLVLFVVLQALILFGIASFYLTVYDDDEVHYFGAYLSKRDRLVSTTSPRLILVGGSNLAFGVDSSRLQDVFDRPVINMGLHFLLGLPTMLYQVEGEIAAGDVVVLSLEYEHFVDELDPDAASTYCKYLEVTRDWMSLFARGNVEKFLDGGLRFIGGMTRSTISKVRQLSVELPDSHDPYCRAAFNAFGDNIRNIRTHSEEEPEEIQRSINTEFTGLDGSVRRLNAFAAAAVQKGAGVVFVYPPIPKTTYRRAEDQLTALHTYLKDHLNIPILLPPRNSQYPHTLFFDTIYHLNRKGVSRRTQQLEDTLGSIFKDG